MSIFAMPIATARSLSIMLSRALGLSLFGRSTIEVAARTFSIRPASIPGPAVTRAPIFAILAGVPSVAFARRRLAHPCRQHFEIDQFVEIERAVSHVFSLRQRQNKTSALSV